MTDKNEKIKDIKSIEVSSFSKELLLIVFGALIGILANQVFFRENKDYEMKVELQRDLLKEQYQYLNRILQFTHRYEIATTLYCAQPIQILTYLEKGTNKVIKKDTIVTEVVNKFSSLKMPSFILNIDKRARFVEDLEYIKSNKDKIDHEVYSKFEELLDIISDNPIPESSDNKKIVKSTWSTKEVQDKWHKTTSELYHLTYGKLY